MSTVVLLSHVPVLGGSGVFYTDSGKFNAKFSGLCRSGNIVQGICSQNSVALVPTNTPPYLGAGETLSEALQACTEMGTDPAYVYYFGDGNFGSVNGANDLYLHSYMRAFSGKTIPGSAYYGQSPIEEINPNTAPSSDNPITTDVTVGTVNPAYIIPWLVVPHATNDNTGISGIVDTAASDNNKLTPADVQVQVREKLAGSWETHSLPYTPGVAGDFQVRAIYVSGSLPVSQTYDVNGIIPEPALAALCG